MSDGNTEHQSYAEVLLGKPGREISGKTREESYWYCRRSLRLRPVPKGTDDVRAVHDYMSTELKLDSEFMDSVGPVSVQRIPSGPGAKIRNEVMVTYQSVDVRDAVKRAARNLAGRGSDFGIRLEIPNYMKSDMAALQSVSYEIRQKYPESRRNVLFCDESMELVLDFSVAQGESWRRMTSTQARERKKKSSAKVTGGRFGLAAGEIDTLLDSPDRGGGQGDDAGP